jgi:hypothetical protein
MNRKVLGQFIRDPRDALKLSQKTVGDAIGKT